MIGNARLVDDNGNMVEGSSGILQMYAIPPDKQIKEWRYVCDDVFHDNTNGPNVACKELGYNAGGIQKDATVQAASWVYWDNVRCDGSENSLANCERLSPGSCNANEAVHLTCSAGT